MRMQLAVQRRRIHQHDRAQQAGRNVAAEVHNRRAGRRQRFRAVGLVRPRRCRVIGRIGEPVLVNRQAARRPHQARNRIRPQIDRHRRRRRVAVLVGDRVHERIEPFLARRRRVREGAVAVIDRHALGGRRRHRNARRQNHPIGAEQIVSQRGGDRKRRAFRHRKRAVSVRLRHVVDDRDVEADRQRVAVTVGDLNRHPGQRDRVLQRAVGVFQRLRQRRRIGVGHIARARTRRRAHQMNADDLARSRTDGANQIAAAIERKHHALAVMRMQLAVQRRRIHQHNRAQQAGRNVAAEVHNRGAGRRQRFRAVGLVRPRRCRVIGRIGEPVLVNRQAARRPHQARNRIRPQIDRHRRRRRVAVLVGDRVHERIEPFLARRRRVREGAVAVIDRHALGGRRRHRNARRQNHPIGAETDR